MGHFLGDVTLILQILIVVDWLRTLDVRSILPVSPAVSRFFGIVFDIKNNLITPGQA